MRDIREIVLPEELMHGDGTHRKYSSHERRPSSEAVKELFAKAISIASEEPVGTPMALIIRRRTHGAHGWYAIIAAGPSVEAIRDEYSRLSSFKHTVDIDMYGIRMVTPRHRVQSDVYDLSVPIVEQLDRRKSPSKLDLDELQGGRQIPVSRGREV